MDMSATLRTLDTDLFPARDRDRFAQMVRSHQNARRQAIHRNDRRAWARIRNRTGWEAFVGSRIAALRASLGQFPEPPSPLVVHLGGTTEGDGYKIENLVFESRPGIFVTANLYGPAQPQNNMPGILLVHSHHNPKTQGELQDMGMLWARAGCLVLVMDQFAYGERGNHLPGPRQDYRFRYITGLQLQTLGDSLMGWMVWDIRRGVDLLLSRDGIAPEKIIVMGSVAGGGDPAAVAAALDDRIACAVPFNFGGPQPETVYPLPKNAEATFDYMGGGSWESTRNLRLSGRDGFLPWVIVGAIAPRRLIYAHEFSWDRDRDPVWKRLQQIYAWYGAPDHLDYTQGFGLLQGRPPEASHCNNIGPPHRTRIYAALERWFGIAPPPEERQERLPDSALQCWTADLKKQLDPPAVHTVLSRIGSERAQAVRQNNGNPREVCQSAWGALLGETEPDADIAETNHPHRTETLSCERIALKVEPHVLVPLVVCLPVSNAPPSGIVVGISQAGKRTFLTENADAIAALLASGLAVCLPDVRGTGESRPEGERTPRSRASALSATEGMLGRPLLGPQLRDLRSVLAYLRQRFSHAPIALWGDSFATTNPAGFVDPLMDDQAPPPHAESLGGLLALFGALFENEIKAIVASGVFTGFQALLNDTYCYMPHDAVIPGALTAGDLCDIAAALAPRPLRLEHLVDGRNCPASPESVRKIYAPAQEAYARTPGHFCLAPDANDIATWLIAGIRNP